MGFPGSKYDCVQIIGVIWVLENDFLTPRFQNCVFRIFQGTVMPPVYPFLQS